MTGACFEYGKDQRNINQEGLDYLSYTMHLGMAKPSVFYMKTHLCFPANPVNLFLPANNLFFLK